jgi:hypothetical protein
MHLTTQLASRDEALPSHDQQASKILTPIGEEMSKTDSKLGVGRLFVVSELSSCGGFCDDHSNGPKIDRPIETLVVR